MYCKVINDVTSKSCEQRLITKGHTYPFPHDISKRKLNVEQDMQNSMHGFEATCLIDMWLLYVPFTLLANCVVAAEIQGCVVIFSTLYLIVKTYSTKSAQHNVLY